MNKFTWTAINNNGAKFYYYPGTGWIDSSDGLVKPMDMTDAPKAQPADATHVQIVNGVVQFVKEFEDGFVSIWRGEWIAIGFFKALRGAVVEIKNGTYYYGGCATDRCGDCWRCVEKANGC